MIATPTTTRVYHAGPLSDGAEVLLPQPASHHLVRVLRMKAGARLALFNGDGAEYEGVIVGTTGATVSVRVVGVRELPRESPLEVTLAQGVSRGERMDYTVQKAVELGVACIEPVTTARSVVRLDERRALQRAAHWQAIAIGACEQCGRNRVPSIASVERFSDWLRRKRGGGWGILLDPDSGRGLRELPAPAGGVTLLAGPEGGLTPEERQAALQAGFMAVRLGPRVLRTETAALAALAAMQALWGDF